MYLVFLILNFRRMFKVVHAVIVRASPNDFTTHGKGNPELVKSRHSLKNTIRKVSVSFQQIPRSMEQRKKIRAWILAKGKKTPWGSMRRVLPFFFRPFTCSCTNVAPSHGFAWLALIIWRALGARREGNEKIPLHILSGFLTISNNDSARLSGGSYQGEYMDFFLGLWRRTMHQECTAWHGTPFRGSE